MSPKLTAFLMAGVAGFATVVGVALALKQGSSSPIASSPVYPSSSAAPTVSSSSMPTAGATASPNGGAGTPSETGAPAESPSTGTASPSSGTNSGTSTEAPALPSSQPPMRSSETVRDLEKCVVQMAQVKDDAAPLNVRSYPSTETPTNIIGQLQNDTFVTLKGEDNGWFAITTPIKGWVAKSKTVYTCGIKVERVSFGSGQNTAQIGYRILGTGTHTYKLDLRQGQRLTLTSQRGPLPALIAPNGQQLTGLQDNQTSWTGTLPASGDYRLALDSNYKGYRYMFRVNVQ